MRILWLTHMLPYPPTGGNLLRTYHLLREASGFARVDVLAFVQRALVPADVTVEAAVKALEEFCSVRGTFEIPSSSKRSKALLALRCALSGSSYTTSWTYSREYADAVRREIQRSHDVIVLDTIGLVRNLPARVEAPIVLNHHNEEVSMLERRAAKAGGVLPRLYFRLEAQRLRAECRRVFPRVRGHLVTSELDRTRLGEIAPDADAVVVPNGVDTSAYPSVYRGGRSDAFTLLFIGGATWYPNRTAIDWLIDEIWPLCKQRIPSARLVIVGRSPTRRSVEAARRDDRLVLAGYVDDVIPWAAGADVFVCPMRDGGGTRLKILHALSLGLPIVSTSMGMEGIDAAASDHYLPAESAEEFVNQLAHLAADPDAGLRLSRAGRDLAVTRYDWKVAGDVVRRYVEAIATPTRAMGSS